MNTRTQHPKRFLSLLAVLLLAVSFSLSVFAAPPLVIDEYGLFDADTLTSLEQQAEDAASGHDCGVYFLVTDSIGEQDQRDYAKAYYISHNLGEGDSHSGILFLLALGSRKYVTITYGGGVTAFTDYRIKDMEDEIVPLLSDGEYAEAAETYISLCADTLDFYAEQGVPLDFDNDPANQPGLLIFLIIVGIAFLISGIVCAVLCAKMKTAHQKTEANDYMPAAGLTLRTQRDVYTHTTRTQVYDPPQQDNNSSSSGGSSVDSDGFGGSSGGSF